MQQLSPMDAMMLYLETQNSPNQINPLIIYEPSTTETGIVRFKEILGNIESRLHLAPSFRKKMVYSPVHLDAPYWVDDPEFNLEYHVRHIALPAPGDWRQFCIQVARLVALRLDRSRPLWEIIVIEGLDNIEGLPKGSFATLYKIHHACMDGVSGAELLTALHDLAPNGYRKNSPEEWHPEAMPGNLKLVLNTAKNWARQPTKSLQAIRRALPAMRKGKYIPKSNVPKHEGGLSVPNTRFNQPSTPYRIFDACLFRLAEVKKLRGLVDGATVNDVALAIVAGGLRYYLDEKGELPDSDLVAGVPISTRSPGSAGGNEITAQTIHLFTDIDDPVERLQNICQLMTEKKAYLNAVGAKELAELSSVIPGQLLANIAKAGVTLARKMNQNLLLNTIVTNVPGSPVPLYFTGAKAVRMLGAGPLLLNVSLIHIVSSYCDDFTINITACRKALPDPAYYADCITRAYSDMVACLASANTKSTQG